MRVLDTNSVRFVLAAAKRTLSQNSHSDVNSEAEDTRLKLLKNGASHSNELKIRITFLISQVLFWGVHHLELLSFCWDQNEANKH